MRNHPLGEAARRAEEEAAGGLAQPAGKHEAARSECVAVDDPASAGLLQEWPLYLLLEAVALFISPAVGEDSHDHHHNYPGLAVRPGKWGDCPGHAFVGLLHASRLAWDVNYWGPSRLRPKSRYEVRRSALEGSGTPNGAALL